MVIPRLCLHKGFIAVNYMTSSEHEQQFYLKKDLTSRDWTDGLITRLLTAPDRIKRRHGGGVIHLFRKERVELIENSEEFKKYQEKTLKRRRAAGIRMIERSDLLREQIIQHIEAIDIKIRNFITVEELYKASVEHYIQLWIGRGSFDKTANLGASLEFLNRISINMLRHECSCYEKELYSMFGKVGAAIAYELLKTRVNQEIIKLYPFLKERSQVSL
jgi:hypothetical protein